jgi:hypothetical protein
LKPWRKFSFYGRFLKVFAKNLQKTPSAEGIPWEEKGPFCPRHPLRGFWFVFFGQTKKMNKTLWPIAGD